MQMRYPTQPTQFEMQSDMIEHQIQAKQGLYGFKASAFPLIGGIVSLLTVLATYFVARDKETPDVDPFPMTDITHCAIKYPQYVIFRIGMMVAPVLFCISFQILKNYLTIKSFEIVGSFDQRLSKFGTLSVACCLLLCLSTSTISDGKDAKGDSDMNWTFHTVGATGFFILAMYMLIVASKIYRELYVIKPFCNFYSYQVKKYTNWVVLFFILTEILNDNKIINVGSLTEWNATFYLIIYFFSLYYDFKDLDIMMIRKK